MASALHLICDGELEIVKITEDMHDQAWQLFRSYFLKYENISTIFNLSGSQQCIDDMEVFLRYILQDNISFAARDCKTKELAAICINKMLNPSTNCTLEEIDKSLKSPELAAICEYLHRMENTHNLYEEWNIDCAMEIVFLSTSPKYAKRGLATTLSAHSIEYAQKMLHDALPDSEQLPAHVRNQKPKAACSVFTSLYTQKLGAKLGFQVVTKIPYKELSYNGKLYAESIDPKHEYSIFAAKRL